MNSEWNPPIARLPRRDILKWFAAAAATSQTNAFADDPVPPTAPAKGYGTDPALAKTYAAGDFWPLTFSAKERRAATALADIILPADDLGPSAGSLRVQDFIDEWISAPYPKQQKDRGIILPGLQWFDEEAKKRFKMDFVDMSQNQMHEICDEVCKPNSGKADLKKAAGFFQRFTELSCGAYYGTPEGWKAIGYQGNLPGGAFNGPPKEILDQLGLAQTVKD